MKENIRIFIIIFIGLFLVLIPQIPSMDLIWSYGFSYNISQGLIPYKDFNMIIGPIYSLCFSLPMIFFGNHLIAYKLMHITLYSIVLTLCHKKIGNKIFWLIPLYYIQDTAYNYNIFIATMTILIILLIDSKNKYKNLMIGLIIGCILMTKQNIGLALALTYLITSKEKKKSILFISIPIAITFIYLIFTNSLYGYINFCYLGMGNFIGNLYFDIYTVIIGLVLILYFIKKWLQTKDTKILYVLSFTVILFPLFEFLHLLVILIPTVYYILENENNKIINRLIHVFIIVGSIAILLNINAPELELNNNFLKYNIVEKETNNYIKNYSKYIQKTEGKTYLFISNAYVLKLYNNETPTFFDLINKGNLGKSEQGFINEIEKTCKREKCTFILDENYFIEKGDQMSVNFKNYVIKNYSYLETIPSNDRVYTNENINTHNFQKNNN